MDPYSTPPANKAELFAWIEAEWQALHRAVQPLNEQDMSVSDEGGWSVKDNLAHLAEWERYLVLNHLRRVPPYEVFDIEPEVYARLKEEDINAILFERNRDRSMEDIVAFLGETHALVMEELSSWKFEDLSQPRFEEDVEKRPVGLFVAGNTYLHYREHRKSIETLLRSESEE